MKAQLTTHDDFVALGMGGRSTGTFGGNMPEHSIGS